MEQFTYTCLPRELMTQPLTLGVHKLLQAAGKAPTQTIDYPPYRSRVGETIPLPLVWHTGTLYNVGQRQLWVRPPRYAALYIIKGQTGHTRKYSFPAAFRQFQTGHTQRAPETLVKTPERHPTGTQTYRFPTAFRHISARGTPKP